FEPQVRLPTRYGSSQRAATVAVADISGNGVPEILVGHGTSAIEWLEFDAQRQLVCTTSIPFDCAVPVNSRVPSDLRVVDIDDNGTLDLVVASSTSAEVLVYFNDGDTYLGRTRILPLTGP